MKLFFLLLITLIGQTLFAQEVQYEVSPASVIGIRYNGLSKKIYLEVMTSSQETLVARIQKEKKRDRNNLNQWRLSIDGKMKKTDSYEQGALLHCVEINFKKLNIRNFEKIILPNVIFDSWGLLEKCTEYESLELVQE